MPREALPALVADVNRLLANGLSPGARDLLRRPAGSLSGPLAEAARVVEAQPDQAAAGLLDLLVGLQQARAGQGTAGARGGLRPLPPSGPWQTSVPATDLYPILDALSSGGKGRREILEAALERGMARDLRLVGPWLRLAISLDPLAEWVAGQVLPVLGRGILPDLLEGFDIHGDVTHARRLLAICRIDPAAGLRLCRAALAAGSTLGRRPAGLSKRAGSSVVVQTQALRCLPWVAGPVELERLAIAFSQDGNRELREAARLALQDCTGDDALDCLIASLDGGAAGQALAVLPHPRATRRLLEELEATLAALDRPASPKKGGAQGAGGHDPIYQRFAALLEVLSRRLDGRTIVTNRIVPLARHPDERVRSCALRALQEMGAATGEALRVLIEVLETPFSGTTPPLSHYQAVGALLKTPSEERGAAVPALLRLTHRSGLPDQLHAQVLRLLPDHWPEYGKAILNGLRTAFEVVDDTSGLQATALEGMRRIGSPAAVLLPDLFRHFSSLGPHDTVRDDEIPDFLPEIDPKGSVAVPGLIRLLGHRNQRVCELALAALKPYASKARAAVPHIRRLLGRAPPVGARAAEVLAALDARP